MPDSLIPIAGFLIMFPAMWFGIIFLISFIGGWHALSQEFAATREFTGTVSPMQSGKIGWANYNNCLNVGTSSDGLFMQPMFLFRFGHPALFIPWNQIESVTGKNILWLKYYVITPRRVRTKIMLPQKLLESKLPLLPMKKRG